MRRVAWIVLWATGAAAGPASVRLKPLSDSERSQRAAEFRKRNPQKWQELVIDPYGFVSHAVTDDRKLGSTDVAGLKAFARRNADFFHMKPEEVDRIAPLRYGGGYEILEQLDGINLGELVLNGGNKEPKLFVNAYFFVDLAPKIGPDVLAQQFAGKTYTVEVTYTNPGHVDCALVGGGKPCPPEVVATERRDVTLAATDVPVLTRLRLDGDELRLVRCVDLSAMTPYPDAAAHHAQSWNRTFTPKAGSPALPVSIDAVTGQAIASGANCDTNRFR